MPRDLRCNVAVVERPARELEDWLRQYPNTVETVSRHEEINFRG